MKRCVLQVLKTVTVICVALIALSWQQNTAFAGGFSTTCQNITYGVNAPTFLEAECLDQQQNLRDTEIDLNNVIQNRDGNLAWDNNGGRFNTTCQACSIEIEGPQFPGSVFFQCNTCQRADGSLNNNPDISLNEKISIKTVN